MQWSQQMSHEIWSQEIRLYPRPGSQPSTKRPLSSVRLCGKRPAQGPLNTYFLHSHHLTCHWVSSHADADAYHHGGRRCGHTASRLTSTLWFPGPSCGRSARNQRFELDTSNVSLWPLPEDCSSSESHTGDRHRRICRRLHLYMTYACPLDALNELHAMSCMRIHVLVALRAWFSGDQSL